MKRNRGRLFFKEESMKNAKKVFHVAMVLGVLLLVLACNSGKKAAMTAEGVEQSITFSGYPMDAGNQTISWFGNDGYLPNQIFASADDSPFHSGLSQMLGVKIAWQFPLTGTNNIQALNLVLASRDLPNVLNGIGIMNNAELFIEEGTIWDLTPYLKEWSPAYWKWLQDHPEYDRAMKTDSGKYYGYGFFREDGGWNDTYLGPVVNKAWLDELGLPMPVTISDWDRTIRAFKERYGATLSFAWSRISGYGTGIAGAFGAHGFADYKLYIDENQKVQLANIQPETKTQLAQFAVWWKDGLIDEDVLSINDTMARTNAMNKKMGISVTSVGQLSTWMQDARNGNTGAEWVGLQYPAGDDGTLAQVPGGLGIGGAVAVISTSTKPENLELVMRALDYGYTKEGDLYWNYGKQGVSWDYDSQGNPAFLPLLTNDPNGLTGAVDKYAGSTWSGNCIQATAMIYMRMADTPEAVAANDLWYYPNETIVAKDKIPSGLTLTTEEATRAAELQAAISTYVNESTVRFFTGQVDFDTWDSYVARVNALGAPELVGIYQAAYDRYLAR